MSNGDDDPADASEEVDAADDGGDAGESAETAAPTLPDDATEESLTEYLDEIADRLEAAETEADLDDVEALLDDAETGIAEADLPEPDEDDEDADDPRGDLEDRVAELRDGVADARGPYGEDVVDAIETAAETVGDTEWTAAGHEDVGLDDAEEWDDLETHEQLRAQGYYDVLGHYKDFPVEWAALKEHEARGNVDMILLALDSLQSDFMERHCLEAFERMGKRGKTDASVEEILGRAEKRDQPAIRILGKMAAEEATDTLVEYVPEDSNPQLQKVVFKSLGEIGAAEAVQPLADRLDPDGDDDELVRPHAARALGLIGDTRAVDPLADALEAHPSDDVRAAAGWALRQIGTREALEAVAEYADEHSFVVSTEGEKAREALDDGAEPAPTA